MKKITIICLVLLSVLMLSSAVFAAGELTVEYDNIFLYSEDAGFYYAKLTNTGDRGIYADDPALEVYDANGASILKENWMIIFPFSAWLEPGESVFVREFLWDSKLAQGIGSWNLTFDNSSWGSHYSEIPCSSELYYEAGSRDNAVFVTFTNTTSGMLHDFSVAAAIYDQNDKLIFVDHMSLSDVGLHPGSTLTSIFDIDSSMTEAYAKENIVPSRVEVHVWIGED